MKFLPLLTVSVSLLATFPCLAANQAAHAWEQEPTSFLGIDLQGDFLMQVPECSADEARPATPCRVATSNPNSHEIHGLPYLPISPGYNLVANLVDGQLQELVFSGNANSLYLVTDMLTDQFDQPTQRESRWIKMNSGASYLTETLSWQGEKVLINFRRQEDDLSKYAVTLSNLPAQAMTSDETPAEALKSDISKL
ncbi:MULTISPECIES: hypothetical protein [Pseudomonas]|uniref:Uncharacterized protein n=1 Tax=Pseudomonas putida TaxID=303 RepID=A0A1B2F2R9_PSEPU|nr:MULTISPECIES: hypothetical protein [Pseudomonas]ANY86500.1 hypothetical protein IEC33019_0924 [Pseudomonas putida]MCL8305209.1 hypothetical protein [Pseudomonas putida]